jgi:hypothetical protein
MGGSVQANLKVPKRNGLDAYPTAKAYDDYWGFSHERGNDHMFSAAVLRECRTKAHTLCVQGSQFNRDPSTQRWIAVEGMSRVGRDMTTNVYRKLGGHGMENSSSRGIEVGAFAGPVFGASQA